MLHGAINSYQHSGGAWYLHLLGPTVQEKWVTPLGLPDPEDGRKTLLQNTDNYQSTQSNIPEDFHLHNASIYSCVCAYFPS